MSYELKIQTKAEISDENKYSKSPYWKFNVVSYVSSRLGHGEVETTFNNYIHVIKELEESDQMKTADIFEKMLR